MALDCRHCSHIAISNPAPKHLDKLYECKKGQRIESRKNEFYGDCEQNIELCSECNAPVFVLYLSDGKCRECEGA